MDPLSEDFKHRLKMPLLLVYGDDDWLKYPGLEADVAKWQSLKNGPSVSLEIIRKAGHHLYLENPTEFNQKILNWAKKIESTG